MPQTPKKPEECTPDDSLLDENDSWGSDQEKRGYYYDDAHGYQTYDPEADEDPDDDADGVTVDQY